MKKLILWILVTLITLITFAFILFFGPIPRDIYKSRVELDNKYCQFMVKTNHQELLNTCRDLMKKYPGCEWRLIDNKYQLISSKEQKPVELPEIIKRLKPVFVNINEDFVFIRLQCKDEVSGGIIAFIDDGNETVASVEIIPGLFCTDDRAYENKEGFKKWLYDIAEKEKKLSKEK